MIAEAIPIVPATWQRRLVHYSLHRETIGMSNASVHRLEADDQPTLFLKSEPVRPDAEMAGEIARLQWMETAALPAPRVLDVYEEHGHQWLLMSAIPGTDMASLPTTAPEVLVRELASALRRLHAVPVEDCPFDQRLNVLLVRAERHMRAGLVDIEDLDDEHAGRQLEALYADLLANRPNEDDLVLCHGDACLPNFLMEAGAFSGYVDCGRLGVADRHHDLALAARSVGFNFGRQAVAPFLAAYGIDPDPHRLAYYRLLDEFF